MSTNIEIQRNNLCNILSLEYESVVLQTGLKNMAFQLDVKITANFLNLYQQEREGLKD